MVHGLPSLSGLDPPVFPETLKLLWMMVPLSRAVTGVFLFFSVYGYCIGEFYVISLPG